MDTDDYDDIIADAATTGGKYDPIEGYFQSGIQTPPGELPAATRT